MRFLATLSAAATLALLSGGPAAAQCWHHHPCYDCGDYGYYSYPAPGPPSGPAAPNARRWSAANIQTLTGKVVEVVYLPGPSPDAAMVELRLQEGSGKPQLVRLAPSGYLKDNGLRIREGDTVTVKGYPVSAMEGELLVATQVQKGEKTLTLRDSFGRSNY
jgi:translation initiation factor IF-1